ncbi:hypothetical protein SN16_11185 [Salinicoccus roseus]|uniref:Uncharacterized protein n=1 Tax=Salinicoccus roseus TaxID=45670 RepID=A0A0C2E3R1_9STAP|nr:hypothetical protein SN16_11185 [Salinicoccus roseus]
MILILISYLSIFGIIGFTLHYAYQNWVPTAIHNIKIIFTKIKTDFKGAMGGTVIEDQKK